MNKFLNLNKGAAAILLAGLMLLTGCGQNAEALNTTVSESAQTPEAEETVVGSETVESESAESETAQTVDTQNWYDTFSLATQTITVYCESDDFSQPVEITDSGQITVIAASIDFSAWEEVPPEEELSSVPAYYIDFHNGTAISMDAESGCGGIGSAVFFERDEDGNLTSWGLEDSTGGTYTFNDGLYDAIVAAVQAAS